MRIERISQEESEEIILTYKPRGLFYFEEDKVWIGIDNSTGDAFVEEFESKEQCIRWLKDKSVENF